MSLQEQEENPRPVVSVSMLALYLRNLLEINTQLQNVWVYGEVSNCKIYSSGHCYFTLKEGDAQLSCVFFKSSRLRTAAPPLRDGMALVVNGRISYYERDGKLQLYVEEVSLRGEGILFQRFEQLKVRLAAEGLFDPARKRALPPRPSVIGIVTSLQAAALRDMLRVLCLRYPLARVVLAPALVQGSEAASSIAAALDSLNEHGEAEVIIIGRGGGSIEELWAFNEEVVARAIARSRIPVISGVGHETDFTIADFVADYRASTPTAAATVAVPNIAEMQSELSAKQRLLATLLSGRVTDLYQHLQLSVRELQRLSPHGIVERRRQQLDESSERLQTRLQYIIALRFEQVHGLALQLHTLSPLLTIGRGYAIVRREDDQTVVTALAQVQLGDHLIIEVRDGTIPVEVRAKNM